MVSIGVGMDYLSILLSFASVLYMHMYVYFHVHVHACK